MHKPIQPENKNNDQGTQIVQKKHVNQAQSMGKFAQPDAIQTKQGSLPPYQSSQGYKPPIQSKQGTLGTYQSKEGKKEAIQAKQRPIQRNTGEGSKPIEGGNTKEAQVKANVSTLMDTDVSEAKVYYNSSKPAQLKAEATAQGNEVHLAPGKEHHLGHELTHVAQQAQGRVQPTIQANNGMVNINDDPQLEKEADEIGAKAHSMQTPTQLKSVSFGGGTHSQQAPVQRKLIHSNGRVLSLDAMDEICHLVFKTTKNAELTDSIRQAFKANKNIPLDDFLNSLQQKHNDSPMALPEFSFELMNQLLDIGADDMEGQFVAPEPDFSPQPVFRFPDAAFNSQSNQDAPLEHQPITVDTMGIILSKIDGQRKPGDFSDADKGQWFKELQKQHATAFERKRRGFFKKKSKKLSKASLPNLERLESDLSSHSLGGSSMKEILNRLGTLELEAQKSQDSQSNLPVPGPPAKLKRGNSKRQLGGAQDRKKKQMVSKIVRFAEKESKQRSTPESTFAKLSIDDAVELLRATYLEDKQQKAQNFEASLIDMKVPGLQREDIPVKVPQYGTFTIQYFTNQKGSAHNNMVAWVSHGVTLTHKGVKNVGGQVQKNFAFLVEHNKKYVRSQGAIEKDDQNKANPAELSHYADMYSKDPDQFSLGGNVPDMLVSAHDEGITEGDAANIGRMAPLCDIAILAGFKASEDYDQGKFKDAAAGSVPFELIIPHLPAPLNSKKNFLMVVCRSIISGLAPKAKNKAKDQGLHNQLHHWQG